MEIDQMPTAYSYIRFSSPAQADGGSLERQVELAQRWIDLNPDYHLDDTLRDLGRSGMTGAHRVSGPLAGFLGEVRSGRVPRGSVMLVEAIDRLSRERMTDALPLMTDLLRAGIRIVTLQDGQNYTEDTINRDHGQIYALVGKIQQAHQYSAQLVERVTHGKRRERDRAIATGQPITAMCPGWLRVIRTNTGRAYERIEDRCEILVEIFDRLDRGESKQRIADNLNVRGVSPFGRAGQGLSVTRMQAVKGWHASYIGKLVANRAVVGEFQPTTKSTWNRKRTVSVGTPVVIYPVVIAPAVYARVRAMRHPPGRRGRVYRNILGPLAQCICGSNMVLAVKGIRRPDALTRRKTERSDGVYLRCDAAARRLTIHGVLQCNKRGLVAYREIERGIINLCASLTMAQDFVRAGTAPDETLAKLNDEVETLIDDERRLQGEIDNALSALGAQPPAAVLAWITRKSAEIDAGRARRDRLSKIARKAAAPREHDQDRLPTLAAAAAGCVDPDERYKMRSEIAKILRRHVDLILIDPASQVRLTWLGGGILYSEVCPESSYVAVLRDQTMHLILTDGSLRAMPIPEVVANVRDNLAKRKKTRDPRWHEDFFG